MKQLHAFFYRWQWWHGNNHPVVNFLALNPIDVSSRVGQAWGNGSQNPVLGSTFKQAKPITNANRADVKSQLTFGLHHPSVIRYDRKKDKSNPKSNDTPLAHSKQPAPAKKETDSESLPLWVRNQKLLGKIFMVWVVLVVFMLLNVFRVIHVF